MCTYFPFDAQLIVNGNHWAQRQASKAGIGFTPLDNGFADCDDGAFAGGAAGIDYIQLSGATKSVNRQLEAKTRALAGWKGYTTDLTKVSPEFVIDAYHRL